MLHVTSYRKRTTALTAPARTDELLAAIDTVAGYLEGERWLLGGGVSVALSIGGFYREHSDLDVVLDVDDLPGVYGRLAERDYRLYTRKLMSHGSFGIAFFMPTRPGGVLMKWHPHRLCFVKRGPKNSNNYLAKLDLYLYDDGGEHYVALDGDYRFKKREPIAGHRHQTGTGREVRCLNLHYVQQFIAMRGGSRHFSDGLAITASIEAAKNFVNANRLTHGGRVDPVNRRFFG